MKSSLRRVIGFSIVELMCSIAIIALLIVLVLPSLARSKATSLRIKTLSNLRMNGVTFEAYSMDWHGTFPCIFNPSDPPPYVIRLPNGRFETYDRYFLASLFWYEALADAYYSGDVFSPVLFDAEHLAQNGAIGSRFYVSCTLITRPEFWNTATRTGQDQYGPTYGHEVAYPSKKTIVYSIFHFIPYDYVTPQTLAPMALADGHAEIVTLGKCKKGVPSGEGASPGWWHPLDLFAGGHTVDGVRGNDLP